MDKSFFNNKTDHTCLISALNTLASKYKSVFMTTIGSSIMGRPIPAIRIGEGSQKLLYLGAHHGAEYMTSGILIKFLFELCSYFESGNPIYGTDPEFIFKNRCIYMIPMVNPDGVDLAIHGAKKEDPLYERLIKINGSGDFSKWQANARGVDINHNYDAGFYEYKEIEASLGITTPCPTKYSGEYPESEPETSAVCAFIRTLAPFKYVFSLHTQGEEIYSGYRGFEPKNSVRTAKMLAVYSGYNYTVPKEKTASYGGLKDWYVDKFSAPAFTIECGKGVNPLPPEALIPTYIGIRKMLFKSLIL